MAGELRYVREGKFWDLMRWIFKYDRFCRWGLHCDYKHDGEWMERCAGCGKDLSKKPQPEAPDGQ